MHDIGWCESDFSAARYSGLVDLFDSDPRVTLASLAHPGLNSSPCFAGSLSGYLIFVPTGRDNISMRFPALCGLSILAVFGVVFGQGKKTSDPCATAQTQAEMNICAGNEYKKADAELNQVYRKLVEMLDDAEKSQLKSVETAWIKYRDANCEFVADQYKGGTIRPMILGLCLADVTKNRTTELRTQIEDRNH